MYLFIDTYTWDYKQCLSIVGLYYSVHTNIELNLIIANQPGIEPGYLGPKGDTLPLPYAPLTSKKC